MVDDLRHWDLDDEDRDSVLGCDVDLTRALEVSRSADELAGSAPSSPPPALDSPDDDTDPSIR